MLAAFLTAYTGNALRHLSCEAYRWRASGKLQIRSYRGLAYSFYFWCRAVWNGNKKVYASPGSWGYSTGRSERGAIPWTRPAASLSVLGGSIACSVRLEIICAQRYA